MLCWSKQASPEARFRERLARPGEAVAVQPLEIHPLLEIHLRDARRLERPVPAVAGVQVLLVDRDELRLLVLFSH
jgi:hypothetical protein